MRRKLEVVGQAVKGLSEETKSKGSDIPWKQIAGMHGKVIHDSSVWTSRRRIFHSSRERSTTF
jgi:uncharacterized protein with HEPN domain